MSQISIFLNAALALAADSNPDVQYTEADITILNEIRNRSFSGITSIALLPLASIDPAIEFPLTPEEQDSYFTRFLAHLTPSPLDNITKIAVATDNNNGVMSIVIMGSGNAGPTARKLAIPTFNAAPTIVDFVPPEMYSDALKTIVKRWVNPALTDGATSMHCIVKKDEEDFTALTTFFPVGHPTERVDVAFSGAYLELLSHHYKTNEVLRVIITEGEEADMYIYVTPGQ